MLRISSALVWCGTTVTWAASPLEDAQDVALDAEIDDDEARTGSLRWMRGLRGGQQRATPIRHEVEGLRRRHLGHEVTAFVSGLIPQSRQGRIAALVVRDRPHHHAVGAQVPGQRPRVDLGDPRDPGAGEVFVERRRILPVRGEVGELANDETADLHAIALARLRARAVVALQGVGHCQQLTPERGISEGFLISGHRRREDNLPRTTHRCTDGDSAEDPAVGEHESRRWPAAMVTVHSATHSAATGRFSTTSRPAKAVATTRPRSSSPASGVLCPSDAN